VHGAASAPLRIFLNYRREDTADQARRLYGDLARRFGRSGVFMDIDTLEGGADFVDAIESALATTDVVISLIGERWLSSQGADGGRRLDSERDWVRAELEVCLALEDVRVIPATVAGARMPDPDELPASLKALARRQAVSLDEESWEDDVARLVALLERIEREKAGTNLPVPATPFLGRERERAHVAALLAREDVRLLTLTGPGGTGKTRLALEAAAVHAQSYVDGVWWVGLAPLRDPRLVLESIGQVLGARDEVAREIGDKTLLLLLDNFEHLLDAGPDIAHVLSACPNLEVLVTSRERLDLPGEQVYRVPSLDREDAVDLFVTRARAVDDDFVEDATVSELCAHLDDLPLAIELAAARSSLFTPEQLLGRISERLDLLKGGRDLDPRQQTLRATISWSHELLDVAEQRLFAALSVFAGGWTYEAAAAVADADPDRLQSLIDKSLVRRRQSDAGPRYWMLETIREYAEERLEDSGEPQSTHTTHGRVRRRHVDYYLALVVAAEPELTAGRSVAEWLERLDVEHANILGALSGARLIGDPDLELRIATASVRFWLLRGRVTEGERQIVDALEHSGEVDASLRAKAINGSAILASARGENAIARERFGRALAIVREIGDLPAVARIVSNLGTTIAMGGDLEGALPLLEESVALQRELGSTHMLAGALNNLASIKVDLRDYPGAVAAAAESADLYRQEGDADGLVPTLLNLGYAALEQGDNDRAQAALSEGLELSRPARAAVRLIPCLRALAALAVRADDPVRAARLLGAADALTDETEVVAQPYEEELRAASEASARAALGDAAFAAAVEEGRRRGIDAERGSVD
jgi:predicted ATPase